MSGHPSLGIFAFPSPYARGIRTPPWREALVLHRWNLLRVFGGSPVAVSSMGARRTARLLQELSNYYCHPGRAGGSPLAIMIMDGPYWNDT
jgi:hypothetical protein